MTGAYQLGILYKMVEKEIHELKVGDVIRDIPILATTSPTYYIVTSTEGNHIKLTYWGTDESVFYYKFPIGADAYFWEFIVKATPKEVAMLKFDEELEELLK